MIGAIVAGVNENSIAFEMGIQEGDKIVSINHKPLLDLIQFQFEWGEEEVLLEIEKATGEKVLFEIEKEYDEQLGVIFNQAVFDGIKLCRNKCLFCFVDQMPGGMRSSLYVKDDDYRLSFLQGGYITLTNLAKMDIERIIGEKLSPLYVSVHTTVPELRRKLLNHPDAGKIVDLLTELSQQGIEFHTQVVLCPGLNDGEALDITFQDLSAIDGVRSIALVPVGITAHREGLPDIRRYNLEEARSIIDWANTKQQECIKQKNSAFIWPSDEFYLVAKRELPDYRQYEDFSQLENGVGMVRLFWEEFGRIILPKSTKKPVKYICVTGESGKYVLSPVVKRLNSIEGVQLVLKVIQNRFFGSTVTVTGLLTGECLLAGLKDIPPCSRVLIPDIMLRGQEGRFLDNITVDDLANQLDIELISIPAEPQSFVNRILMV